jgi:chromosome segregation ATPase
MHDYALAAWSIVILADLLIISVVVNIVVLRRRRSRQGGGPPPSLVQLIESVSEKSRGVKDLYRRVIGNSEADMSPLLEDLEGQTKQLGELLHSAVESPQSGRRIPYAMLMQPLWHDIQDNHALLYTTAEQLLSQAQQLQQLMETMSTQDQLLQELTERSTTYETELEDLVQKPQEEQLTSEVLKHLKQRYLEVQQQLQALTANSQNILAQQSQPKRGFEQYRNLFEAMHKLKLDGVRLSEELQSHTSRAEWMQQEKTRLEQQIERFKEAEEAHRIEQRRVKQLEGQLERANAEIQKLKSEVHTVTAEYLRLFEQQQR